MPDYWCHDCGGRTSMMGHRVCNPKTKRIVDKLKQEGVPHRRAVEAVGMWQIGEVQLP